MTSYEPMPPQLFEWVTGQNPDFARWLFNLRDNIADVIDASVTNGRLAFFNSEGNLISKDLAELVAGTTDEITIADDGDGTITISLPNAIKLDGATASRLLATDGSKKTTSADLASWIAGTSDEITVTDDGDGTVTLSLPNFSFSNDRMYLTNVATARAIDRTSDVITSTVTVADTTTETTIFTGTIAANALRAGNVLKVYAKGVLSNDSASDDITLRGYIGSTLLGTFNPAIGNVTDALWHLDAMFTVRSVGASGSVAWAADFDIDGNTTEGEDISTVDTTASEDFTVTVEWDNAKAGNTISIYQGIIEWKN
jgi:hypothetical protein